jgi:hypothetical protein
VKHVKHSDLNLLSAALVRRNAQSLSELACRQQETPKLRDKPNNSFLKLSKDGVMMTYVEPTHYFYSFPLDGSFLVQINLGSKSTKNSASALSQKAGRAPSLCLHPPLGKLRVSIESIELPLLDLGVAAASAEANRVLQRSKG